MSARRLGLSLLIALALLLLAADASGGNKRSESSSSNYGYPEARCSSAEEDDPLVVCTSNGPVRGFLEYVDGKPIAIFKGIPYAEPPVGQLRWKAPVPLASRWTTPFDATNFGPLCPPGLQYPDPYNRPISEDCLTVNVWAPVPDDPQEKMPVMVWIHGGAFVEGAPEAFGVGNFSLYAVTHRTVVVAASYRFNALGFFSSDLLLGHSEPEARGVFGLYDQRLGLKWTQINVGAFGGDSNKVTIYGQSAGAISVCLQSVTPLNDAGALFRSSFSSSGYCSTLPATNNSADTNLIASLGCSNLACLLGASWQSLAAAVGTSFLSFQPTVGGNSFLPDQPVTLLAERALARAHGDRSVFMPEFYARGSTADEGTFLLDDLFLGLSGPNDPNGPSQPVIDFVEIGLANYTTEFYYAHIAPLYSTQFNPQVSSPGEGLIQSTNDIMLCSLRRDLSYFSLATSAYGWFFDSAPATAEYPAWVGAFHESDVFYVAKHADGIWVTELTPQQLELGSKMDVYWNAVVQQASLQPLGVLDPLHTVPRWTPYSTRGPASAQSVMRFTASGEGKGTMGMVPYSSLADGYYTYESRCNQLDSILAAELGVPALDVTAYLAAVGSNGHKRAPRRT